MLKRSRPADDWTARRTGDVVGREALLLAEPSLAGIWEILNNPYLAFSREVVEAAGDENVEQITLLMHDLGPWLVPASAGRLSIEREDLFLRMLAALHARFWQSDALQLPWLAAPTVRFSILGPGAAVEELACATDHPLFRAVERGWEIARDRLPEAARTRLLRPADEIAAGYAHLPQTLLHGDAKIGNCAFLPDGRLTLFDWATMGVGPATLDLGYYLAVDATRHGAGKEEIITRYRICLQDALRVALPDDLWEEMLAVAITGGARMLLWSKALALETRSVQAESEWQWWVDRL
jgi:hypothetical protein